LKIRSPPPVNAFEPPSACFSALGGKGLDPWLTRID
jgi:hypothetical protein